MELRIADHLKFRDEHRQLLASQVLLVDSMDGLTKRMDGLTERVDKLAATVQELAEARKHTDEHLNALITVVDGIVRRGPQPS